MKKFRFRLQAVLAIKKVRESESLRMLGAAQTAFIEEVDKKSRLAKDLEKALLRREGLGTSFTTIATFNTEQIFINGIKHKMIQADQAIFRARKQVEKCLYHYLKSKRETKVMEVLREKAYAEYRKERSKYEMAKADEQILMRFHKKENIA